MGGKLIARHVDHDWVCEGHEYLRLDCAARVEVAFLDERNQVRAQFGPYLHFSTMDGIAFGNHEVLAHIDSRTQRWFLLQDGTDWPRCW